MTLAPVRCPRAEMLHHLQCGVHSARLSRQLSSPTSTSQVGLARSFIGSCRSCDVCCRIQCQPSTRVPSLQPVAQEDSRGSWPSPEQKLLVVPPDNLRLHTSSPTTGPPRPRLSATQRPSGALSASAHLAPHRNSGGLLDGPTGAAMGSKADLRQPLDQPARVSLPPASARKAVECVCLFATW